MDLIIQVLLLSIHTFLDSSFSCWAEILFGVPQGSILGPLLFNAYICDLFFEVRVLEYASFADDTTPYSCLPEMIPILEKLEKGIQSMFDWFSENFLNRKPMLINVI